MVAAATMASAQSILLEGGGINTSGPELQAAFRIFSSAAAAPVVQQLTSRRTAPWLVQFDGVLREEWKAAVESRGGLIHGYVPENALLVEASPETISKIASMDEVAWAGEVLPAYKKSKAVREWTGGDPDCIGEFRVRLFHAADKPRIARAFGELNLFVSREDVMAGHGWLRVRLSPKQVDEVAAWGEVEWIEPDRKPRSWGSSAPLANGSNPLNDVEAVLQQAFDVGERVHWIGWGVADAGSCSVDSHAIDRFVWEHPEMLVVAAAGNAAVDVNPADGVADPGSIGSPATAKNVLSVGAAEGRRDVAHVWVESWPEDFAVEPIAMDRMAQSDGPQGMAAFSSRGPCADGRIKPDMVAPGTFLVAPRPADSDFTGWGVAGNTNEIYVGGTGVAAEQVVTAAAQVRRWLIEHRGMSSPSAALVKALLISGARNLAPGQYGAGAKQEIPGVRPNTVQGFGLLNVSGAVQTGEGEYLDLHDRQGLATGETDIFELNAGQGGGRFVLTLAYSDYGAVPLAGSARVNDLDLTVQTPSGAILHANGRDKPDALNNVEMIEFEADEAGVHLARVEARAVPMGGIQPYALVIRGPNNQAVPNMAEAE